MVGVVFVYLCVDVIGCVLQCEFVQCDQVVFVEEVVYCVFGLLCEIDFVVVYLFEQFFGWQVDECDFVGCVEYVIGYGFLYVDVGDCVDYVVQVFEVLDVDGCIDVDVCVEQFVDVLLVFQVVCVLYV